MALTQSLKRATFACRELTRHCFARSFTASRDSLPRLDSTFRLAIIGSGPAGFYTAYRVLSKIPHAQIDMYESSPVPFGLVRYGVAPDHPEVKNCQDKFEEIASSPRFRFLGNVSIDDVPTRTSNHCCVQLESLRRHYHSIIFAYGASEDKKLGIPGESTLQGIYSARQFVGWYNGLPACAHLDPDLRGEEAVIIGQGNVALDVARMLLEDVDALRKTDIAEHALARIAQSRIRRVHVVGRRGPMQATFTIKEVRELMKLSQVAFHPVNRMLIPSDISILSRTSKRLMEVLLKGSSKETGMVSRSWSLDSCLSPKTFISKPEHPSLVAATEFHVTNLAAPFDPRSPVTFTGESKTLPSNVVFRSIGYRSKPLSGFADAGIQFDDERGILRHDGLGRVTRLVCRDSLTNGNAEQIHGMYCAGWVKRGPTGVIASTMQDAFATGDSIIEDWQSGVPFLGSLHHEQSPGGWDAVKQDIGTAALHAVTWEQWRQIDSAERERGRARGKEREKFTRTGDMLAVIG